MVPGRDRGGRWDLAAPPGSRQNLLYRAAAADRLPLSGAASGAETGAGAPQMLLLRPLPGGRTARITRPTGRGRGASGCQAAPGPGGESARPGPQARSARPRRPPRPAAGPAEGRSGGSRALPWAWGLLNCLGRPRPPSPRLPGPR